MAMNRNELDHRFAYHPPQSDEVRALHGEIRTKCWELACWMDENVPEGREMSVVIKHIEDAMMWANAAVARSQ